MRVSLGLTVTPEGNRTASLPAGASGIRSGTVRVAVQIRVQSSLGSAPRAGKKADTSPRGGPKLEVPPKTLKNWKEGINEAIFNVFWTIADDLNNNNNKIIMKIVKGKKR